MRNEKRYAVLSAVAATVILSPLAGAATYTWTPTAANTYNWINSSQDNWGTGSGGAYPNAAGDVANVNINIAGNQTIRLAAPITLGTLNFGDSDGTNSTSINNSSAGGAATPANVLTFESAAPGGATALNLSATGSVTNTISANIAIGGTSSLTVNLAGTQVLTTSGTFATGTSSNTTYVTGANGSGTNWNVNGDLTGSGTIVKNSLGNMSISGAKAFTGTLVVNRGIGGSNTGSVTVNTGSLANASEIIINGAMSAGITQAGGVLHGGNSSAAANNPGQRISSNTITLNGGSLEPAAQSATVGAANPWQQGLEFLTETTAVLKFNSAYSYLLTGASATTAGTKLNFTTVNRSVGATAYVRATNLGSATVQVLPGNGSSLLAAGGGGTGPGTTTMSIIPWLGANNTASGTSAPGGFATYIAGVGVRSLVAGEYNTSITSGDTQNVSTAALALASDATVYSLLATNGSPADLGLGRTLTVKSGGVMFSFGGAGIGTTGPNAGTLNFGTAEGVIWSQISNANSIGAVIAGSGGLTKTGTGTLTVTGVNTYTNGTHVSAGSLVVSGSGKLGDGDARVHNGATLRISAADVISDTASLKLDQFGLFNGKVTLDPGILEQVGALYFGDALQSYGTWGSTLSAATFQNDTYFSGTGILNVVAVPEPASLAMLALAGVMIGRRRRD